ncbi:excitatory amino acid transporter 1-like isoform X2 [Paramacrobiotus metropolitanus]|uniref:excitatory amino acid transporter 1-like isoform X2 n=1 Tax=Paramacrobiotus metropolitanus TaxID=2943436 RepID=UPI002445CF8D|nr:excitatory amino acid transporter 1-like isoform X2 [Paramacrobiotus metropolitanus]
MPASVNSKSSAKLSPKRRCLAVLLENLRLILLIAGICIGVALAFGLRAAGIHQSARKVAYVAFLGELFLSMLKCIIIPLMASAIISGLSNMESAASGQIGFRSVVFYLTTVFIAVCVGIGMVSAIRPGYYGTPDLAGEKPSGGTGRVAMTADTIMDLIRNMFPPNIVQACVAQYQTQLMPPPNKVVAVVTNSTGNTTLSTTTTTTPMTTTFIIMANNSNTTHLLTPQGHFVIHDYSDWIMTRKVVDGTNILGIVVFSLVCGVAISRLKEHGKPLGDFFRSLNQVVMQIVDWIMWLAPIGVCFLVAGQLLKVKDFASMFAQLGMYMVTVLSGLGIHAFLVLPLICFVFTRKNPYRIIHGGARAYATGFGTASSAATLPITINCCEENNKVDPRICRFTLPIATAINLDGTALYEAVAALFIAQTENVPMDFGKIVAVSVTATAAAVGAAGIPEAGLVTSWCWTPLGFPPSSLELFWRSTGCWIAFEP